MAFRMNRPVIKGTANHKASIAKAKATSVVSQSRTKGDAGLIAAANTLGESYKPQAIDFELDKIDIDVPEKKEKKPLTPEEQAAKDARKAERKAKRKKFGKNILDKAGKLVEGVGTLVGGALLAPVAIGDGLFKLGGEIVDKFGNIVEGAKADQEARLQAKKDATLAEQQASSKARFNQLMVEDEEENDFSAIEAEPDVDYETSGAVDRGYKTWKHKQDAENIRSARETSDRMNKSTEQRRQEAAKKHNVKVEDLEAKHIGPENEPLTKEEIEKYGKNYVRPEDLAKRQFYPKQDVVGGKEETRWDDELGRFRKPEATIPVGKEEQEKAVEEMKPKFPEGMDPNLATTGEIALNYDTNTYEYTQQYFDRLAKEKIEQQKVEPTSATTEQVVEENKTPTTTEKPKVSDFRTKKNAFGGTLTAKEQYEKALKEYYSKSAMQMRDNRIYRNAVKGGTVQQNMIKSGYKPE